MNHKHQRRNYAGGYVRQAFRPGGAWWKDLPPTIIHAMPITGLSTTPKDKPMNLAEIRANLKELEEVLDLAEELRYRILSSLQEANNAVSRPATDNPTSPTTPSPIKSQQPTRTNGHRNHPDLMRTGRGLFAWAKEHGRIEELVAIGKQLSYPARIVDWASEQIDTAVAMMDAADEEPAVQQEAEPNRRFSSRRSRNKAAVRVPGADDDSHDQNIPY